MKFTKMHGLGNDFVVIDLLTQDVTLEANTIRRLADRHFGIGCDQLLTIEAPTRADADFRYRIYNSDGNEVEQCGNGARCVARFVLDKQLTVKQRIRLDTKAGLLELWFTDDGQVCVDMGQPILEPAAIPFNNSQQATSYWIDHNGTSIEIGALSMGNPHLIHVVDNVATAPVASWGPALESHADFPQHVNVSFMEIIDRNAINLRVFERGVGETLACGSGACAAVVSGCLRNLLDSPVTVNLPGGQLLITWPGAGHTVTMTGPAVTVFEGYRGQKTEDR